MSIKLAWVCLGDPRDHHAAIPCAPDRLPEYTSNQEHDSFRAFRSHNLNVSLALETKPTGSPSCSSAPTAVLYGSTLRWFESLKFILSGATRPTRKGPLFKNIRPRKKQLSRHYRKLRLTLAFHRFHVSYWMSFAMQRGFEVTGENFFFLNKNKKDLEFQHFLFCFRWKGYVQLRAQFGVTHD